MAAPEFGRDAVSERIIRGDRSLQIEVILEIGPNGIGGLIEKLPIGCARGIGVKLDISQLSPLGDVRVPRFPHHIFKCV